MIDVKILGANSLRLQLVDAQSKIKKFKRLFRQIAASLSRSFKSNMTSGVDPDGSAIKPAAPWVRFIAGKNPASKALHVTGSLRRSIGPLSITDNKLVFGFHGRYSSVAIKQTEGHLGFVKVSEKLLRRMDKVKIGKVKSAKKTYTKKAANGNKSKHKIETGLGVSKKFGLFRHRYIRVNIGSGRWITKTVLPGGYIKIRPQRRKFFFLGKKDVKNIGDIVKKYVDGVMENVAKRTKKTA